MNPQKISITTRCTISFILILISSGCVNTKQFQTTNVPLGDFIFVGLQADGLIQQVIKEKKIQGISIALVDNQKLVWAKGYGYADNEAKRLASADTIYRVGSLSKLFTNTAVMQLVEKEKLNLDQPVHQVLPRFSPKSWDGSSTELTARMLMTHHAGLARDLLEPWDSIKSPRFTDYFKAYDGYLTYQPNQLFSYSNVGSSILGTMIEQSSGERFEEYLKNSILKPIGMWSSSFDASPTSSPQMAKGYIGIKQMPDVPLRDLPAGGLNSSVIDLSRFLSMIFSDGKSGEVQVLKQESLLEMFREQNADVPLDFGTPIGLGWFLQNPKTARIKDGGWVASHDGAIDGFRSTLMILPEQKLGVVVLANSASATGSLRYIATQVLKMALEAKTGVNANDNKKNSEFESDTVEPKFTDAAIKPSVLENWIGDYTTKLGHIRVYSKDGKTLRVDALGYSAELHKRADGRFSIKYKLLGIVPAPLGPLGTIAFSRENVGGREIIVAREDSRDSLLGERISSQKRSTNAEQFVDTFVGNYEVIESGLNGRKISSARILEVNNVLVAELKFEGQKQSTNFILQPLSATQAIVLGSLKDRGDMLFASIDKEGNQELRVLGLHFRKLTP